MKTEQARPTEEQHAATIIADDAEYTIIACEAAAIIYTFHILSQLEYCTPVVVDIVDRVVDYHTYLGLPSIGFQKRRVYCEAFPKK